MKIFASLFCLAILLLNCKNNDEATGSTTQAFCDTTCTTDTFLFTGTHKMEPFVSITVDNCTADTLTYGHGGLSVSRQMHLPTTLGHLVRLNKSALDVYFKDTSYAWLKFNDCTNGRGYLMKLPFNKKESVRKMSSAVNSFDKKFVVPEDFVAYLDYSTIYVENMATGKSELMTFKERYDMDFNDVHKIVDSVNISHDRIFVQLIKEGKPVQIEKNISL